ncbi:hypothetical protein QF026_008558 [Streptomyces aurantiacus]|nr:hypothetical protein [Streptomyces aurantiacus]
MQLLPAATESRHGYQRTSFKHWVDADQDSCHTRSEVLIAESQTKPTIEASCKVTAGEWYSYYDGVTLTVPGGLDIDHMVPLAEAWDSDAHSWTPARREAYAKRPRCRTLPGRRHRPQQPLQVRPGPGRLAAAPRGCPLHLRSGLGRHQTRPRDQPNRGWR